MKQLSFLLITILLFSCNKKNEEIPDIEPPKEYMKKMIEPDTVNAYKGEYYIRADFKLSNTSESKELVFTETQQNMSVWSEPSPPNLGMSKQGVVLSDLKTRERLWVNFCFNTSSDTVFTLAYADYQFADPWHNIAGITINYTLPVPNTSSIVNTYVGKNDDNSYCHITYIGNDRINGSFHTTWTKLNYSSGYYDVYGDFSIPLINANVYVTP